MKNALIFILACMLAPFAASAQQLPRPEQTGGGGGGRISGKWWKNSAVVRTLQLSDAQVRELEAVYLQHEARLAELRSAVLQNEEQLRTLLEAEQLNESALAFQKNKLASARLDLENENSDMTLGMRRVMTAVQWRALEKLRQDRSTSSPVKPVRVRPRIDEQTPVQGEKVYELPGAPGLQDPIAVSKPRPAYTPEAKAAKVEGVMLLQAVILKDGSVGEMKVIRGLGYGLDESAMATVRQSWLFKPGLRNGQAVNVLINIEISFRLR